MKILEERNAQLRGVNSAGGKCDQRNGNGAAGQNLQREFMRAGQAQVSFLHHFAVIVDETDHAEHQHGEDGEPHVGIFQVAPEQRGNHRRAHDQHAAHGRRSGLGLMALRPFLANELADLQVAQPLDHPRTQHQGDHQSREAGERRAHGDVAKHVERMKIALQHVIEEVEEHLRHAPWARHRPSKLASQRSRVRTAHRALRRSVPFSRRANLSPAECRHGCIKLLKNSPASADVAKNFACAAGCPALIAPCTRCCASPCTPIIQSRLPVSAAAARPPDASAPRCYPAPAFHPRQVCGVRPPGVLVSSSIIAPSATGFEL